MRSLFGSIILFTCAASVLPACVVEKSCTAIAVTSVSATVVDSKGTLVTDAKVTFSVDGGKETEALCNGEPVDVNNAAIDCEVWSAGIEQTGHFTLKAVSADGTQTTQSEVTVVEDENQCHPVPQTVELKLPASGSVP